MSDDVPDVDKPEVQDTEPFVPEAGASLNSGPKHEVNELPPKVTATGRFGLPLSNVPATVTAPLIILAALGIGFALYFLSQVLVPLVLAILISYLVVPLVDLLQKRAKLPRAIGVLVALFVITLLFIGIAALISASVRTLAVKGPKYQQRILLLVDYGSDIVNEWGQKIALVFESPGADDANQVLENEEEGQGEIVAHLEEEFELQNEVFKEWISELPLSNILLSMLNNVALWTGNALLIFVFVIYLVGGRGATDQRGGIWSEIDLRVRRYIMVKVATSALTGILVGAILAIIGLDLAVVFGLLAFLLNFIPTVGSIVATLLPLPIAMVQYDSLGPVLLVILIPGIVQLTIGNLIEPKIMGSALSLHPITVLLALIFWGILWGAAGMLFAAPITAVIKIVLDRIPGGKPISGLLEGKLPEAN